MSCDFGPRYILKATEGEEMTFIFCLTDTEGLPLFSNVIMRVRLPDGALVQATGSSLGVGVYQFTFGEDIIPCGEHLTDVRFLNAAGVPIMTFPDCEEEKLAIRVKEGDLT